MNNIKKASLLLAVVLLFLTGYAQQERYVKIKIDLSKKTIQELMSLGIADEGEFKKGCCYTTEMEASSLQKLQEKGFLYEILIEDMTKFYQERNKKSNEKVPTYCPSSIPNYGMPSHFRHGSMGGYLTHDQALAELDSMRHYYPNLISMKAPIDTFHSVEGRPLYFVRLSDNASTDENEPEVLYLGLTHAREPMGMQQLIWFMWYLLENYDNNPEIAYLLNNSELYFVPIVNPDGYVYNQTSSPEGGGMWRKNRRQNGGSMGVDLNRNYGFEWGYDDVGSSIDPTAETYRGLAGFSEPETQAVKWFCEHRNFSLSIDYHTYSNILLYPWGYIDQVTPDQAVFEAYAQLLTSDNHFAYGTPGQLLYTTNGGSFDWFYGEQSTKGKILALSPEAGNATDGFWPAEDRINELCNTFATMNLMMARLTNKYASLEILSSNVTETATAKIKFSTKILGLDTAGTFTASIVDIDNVCSNIGTPKNFVSPNLLQQFTDSIEYTLNTMNVGTTYRLLLKIENGPFARVDTLSFIYGAGSVTYHDACNTTDGWVSAGGTWSTTTTTFVSAPSSISDGIGTYSNNSNKSITTVAAVDLTQATMAHLSYFAKWGIEQGYDYVQILVSENNGTSWLPLCGRYTTEGGADQMGVEGQPVYQGSQSTWVSEQIDLSDYIGKQVKFRFTLVTDGGVTDDGFYFDDFKVSSYNLASQSIDDHKFESTFILYPNPTCGEITIINKKNESIVSIELFDMVGNKVYEKNESTSNVKISLPKLPKGYYYMKIETSGLQYSYSKLVIY